MRHVPHGSFSRHRRGSAYIAVLGTTMLVTLLGVTGLTALRLERATHEAAGESDRAALLADSALELALSVTQSGDWRDEYNSGEWSDRIELGGGEVRYRFIDEDGNLTDDESDAITVEGEGLFGPAGEPRSRRRASVRLDPGLRRDPRGASIVRDGTMGSVASWTPNAADDVEAEQKEDGGNEYLLIKKRQRPADGAMQNLSGRLTTAGTYDVSLRARMSSGSDTLVVQLSVRTADGMVESFALSRGVGASWSALSGTIATSWGGTLQAASLEIFTASGKKDIAIDDVAIRLRADAPAPVVPGSWRRVVLSGNETDG